MQFSSLLDHADALTLDLSSHYIPLKDMVSEEDISTRGERLELIYKSVIDSGIEASPAFFDSIVNEFERIGDIERAQDIVKVYEKTIETYNSLMRMYDDNSVVVLELLQELRDGGLIPDSETYLAISKALCNSAEYLSAFDYYEESIEAGITPHPSFYPVMLACWCRSGEVEKAIDNVRLDPLYQNPACILALSEELASLKMWDILTGMYGNVKETIDIPARAIFLRAFLNGSRRDLKEACGVLKDVLDTSTSEDIEGVGSEGVISMYESLLQFIADIPPPPVDSSLKVDGTSDAESPVDAIDPVDTDALLEVAESAEVEESGGEKADSPIQFCRDLVLDLQRNQVRMSPVMLGSLVQIYTQYQDLDDAMQVYLNFCSMQTQSVVNNEIPVVVYDTLLSSLAENYRMQEFSSIWESVRDTPADSTLRIALDAFIATMDIPSAMSICKNVMIEVEGLEVGVLSRPARPPISVFMDLFESCAITGKYGEMVKVLQWIRRIPRSGKSLVGVSHILEKRIVPISQSIIPLISHLPPNNKHSPSILLYNEFLSLEVPLPYPLFTAVISYYARANDMVNIAKTMSIVIKQSHATGNAPKADCIAAFLTACRELCGKEAASSVLKLVCTERLELDASGYQSLLIMSARNGWVCEMCDFVDVMSRNKCKIGWKLYGELGEMMKENGHGAVREVFEEFMVRGYPEVVGEAEEWKESGEYKNMRRVDEVGDEKMNRLKTLKNRI
jgi:tetratricopeptide (TPR) repeat protein